MCACACVCGGGEVSEWLIVDTMDMGVEDTCVGEQENSWVGGADTDLSVCLHVLLLLCSHDSAET